MQHYIWLHKEDCSNEYLLYSISILYLSRSLYQLFFIFVLILNTYTNYFIHIWMILLKYLFFFYVYIVLVIILKFLDPITTKVSCWKCWNVVDPERQPLRESSHSQRPKTFIMREKFSVDRILEWKSLSGSFKTILKRNQRHNIWSIFFCTLGINGVLTFKCSTIQCNY